MVWMNIHLCFLCSDFYMLVCYSTDVFMSSDSCILSFLCLHLFFIIILYYLFSPFCFRWNSPLWRLFDHSDGKWIFPLLSGLFLLFLIPLIVYFYFQVQNSSRPECIKLKMLGISQCCPRPPNQLGMGSIPAHPSSHDAFGISIAALQAPWSIFIFNLPCDAKKHHFYYLNNSFKPHSVLVIFGTQIPEWISHPLHISHYS